MSKKTVIPKPVQTMDPSHKLAAAQAIGAALADAREKKKLKLEEAAEQLRLRPKVIHEMESGEFATQGGSIYTEIHLANYAKFLSLDGTAVLRDYRAIMRKPEEEVIVNLPDARRDHMRPAPVLLAGAVVAILALYGIWYVAFNDKESVQTASVPAENNDISEEQPSIQALQAEPAPTASTSSVMGEKGVKIKALKAAEITLNLPNKTMQIVPLQEGEIYFISDTALAENVTYTVNDESAVEISLPLKEEPTAAQAAETSSPQAAPVAEAPAATIETTPANTTTEPQAASPAPAAKSKSPASDASDTPWLNN